MSSNVDLLTRPVIVARVRSKARQLVGSYGFTAHDEEDLRQELFCSLLEGLPKFRPSLAGVHTFAWRLVRNRVSSLIEYQTAKRRCYYLSQISLNDLIESGDDGGLVERGDLLSSEDVWQSVNSRRSIERLNLRIDLLPVVSALSPELRSTANLLGKENLNDIAIALGISRLTLYRRVARLRAIFAEAGLARYVNACL